MMIKIFFNEFLHPKSYELLQKHFEVIDDYNRIGEVQGIITRNIKVDKNLMDQMPNLKVVGIHGTGVDDLDVEEANKRGIDYYNTPYLNALSVSELNVTLMLSISRKIRMNIEGLNQGIYTTSAPSILEGNEVSNKTAGFIGFGHIAKGTARILHLGFNMNIKAYNRSKIEESYVEQVSLEEVLKQSDYLFIGLSLNKDTYHLLDKDKLSLIKDSAYLINTTRGAIIDEKALYDALVNHQIKGFASDVVEDEPISKDSPLLKLNHVLITNHIGANTDEALRRVGDECVNKMIEYFKGENV